VIFRDDKTGWDGAAISIAVMLLLAPVALTFHMAHRGDDPAGPDPRYTRGYDMVQFWVGAAVLESSVPPADLYDADTYARAFDSIVTANVGRGYGPTYPPPIYQAFGAVDGIGQIRATKLLLWLYLLAAGLGIALLLRSAGYQVANGVEVGLLLWSAPAALLGVSTGQSSGFWLAFLAAGFVLWRREKKLLAGVAFSLLCIKPTLAAPVVLALVLASQWRVIAGFVLGGSLLLAFSISIDGVEIWRGYVDMMLRNPDLTQQLWSSLERHFSFRSLVSVPFRETSLAVPVGALGSVAAVMLAIWFRQKLTPTLASAPHSFPALSLLLGACAFATPHLLDYDLVLYFPLMIWASYRIAEKRAHNMGLGIAALSAFYVVPIAYPISARIDFSVGSLVALLLLLWCASEVSQSYSKGDAIA
jgi:hypothetical protein